MTVCEIAGRIDKIHFTEGQKVAAGALLFSLDRQAFSDESDMPRHAVLLKASNAARIGGVVCSTDASVIPEETAITR